MVAEVRSEAGWPMWSMTRVWEWVKWEGWGGAAADEEEEEGGWGRKTVWVLMVREVDWNAMSVWVW